VIVHNQQPDHRDHPPLIRFSVFTIRGPRPSRSLDELTTPPVPLPLAAEPASRDDATRLGR
jgi:hypothetical protein